MEFYKFLLYRYMAWSKAGYLTELEKGIILDKLDHIESDLIKKGVNMVDPVLDECVDNYCLWMCRQ